MDWWSNILSLIGGSVTTFVGTILYFRPKLKAASAEAHLKETEAADARYDFLQKKIADMEETFELQNDMMNNLRQEVLKLSEQKFQNEQRIITLEGENKELKMKVEKLEAEVQSYRSYSVKTQRNGKG